MKVDVELEPFTPLLRPTYADAHAGAISEVRMEGYEFGHTYVWQGPDTYTTIRPVNGYIIILDNNDSRQDLVTQHAIWTTR